MSKLADKTAVITGAGSGIGRATAIRFAEEGARLVLADSDGPAADETARMTNADCVVVCVDVSFPADMSGLASRAIAELGHVDIVFANAGIVGPGTAAETEVELWDRVVAVNLTGVWLTSKYMLPHMVERKTGSIINTASVGGIVGVGAIASYAATKGGVIALSKQMAVDYGPYGIRVNTVCPGHTMTALVENRILERGDNREEYHERTSQNYPLRCLGRPEEIANAVLYLASDDARWTTGIDLIVDGGFTAG